MSNDIVIQLGVPLHCIPEATALYCEAFTAKLTPFLGAPERAARVLAGGVSADRAYVAMQGDAVLGIAGFKVDGRGLFEPGLWSLVSEYGWSAPARILGLVLLERAERPDVLLMDGIAVGAAARGKGVGTRLLQAIEEHARALNKRSIRLDVINTNPGARRLYERVGYQAGKTRTLGPLTRLFPFQSSTEMQKLLPAQG